jgi:hypothetical protein
MCSPAYKKLKKKKKDDDHNFENDQSNIEEDDADDDDDQDANGDQDKLSLETADDFFKRKNFLPLTKLTHTRARRSDWQQRWPHSARCQNRGRLPAGDGPVH